MARKKKEEYKPPAHWQIHESYTDGKHTLNVGDTCKIKGETGTYRFRRHVVNTKIENHEGWIDIFGGSIGYGSFRSISPDRLKIEPPKKTRRK